MGAKLAAHISSPPPPITIINSTIKHARMSLSEQIAAVKAHLDAVNTQQTTDLDDRLVAAVADHVTLDKTATTEDPAATLSLLQTVSAVLLNDQLAIDYEPVIQLLDALLSQLDFDTVSRQFDFAYILEALSSPNENLQIVALKVLSKAQPPDILANTVAVPRIIDTLANKDTPLKVVNEIEKTLNVLFRGQLIRRRVLTKDVMDVLYRMKNSVHAVVVVRVMKLIVMLTPLLTPEQVPSELYHFDFIPDEDVMLLFNLIKFYSDLVDIGTEVDKEWVFEKIEFCFDAIGSLYKDRYENPDVMCFLGMIEEFFKKLSYSYPFVFHSIDERYIKLTKDDTFLLATLNPSFLVSKYPRILKQMPVTIDTVPIIRNLIADEMAFTAILSQLTASQILRLPYLELMAVTIKLAQFEYSAKYLLNNLPQVMNKLLKGDNVIEPETWELRRGTLENLLKLPHEILDIWHAAIQLEYDKLVKGRAINPAVEVMDAAM